MRAAMHLSLRDRLSRLTRVQAEKLLGPHAKNMLCAGSARYANGLDLAEAARFDDDAFTLDLYDAAVTITLSPEHRNRLACRCSACERGKQPCEHIAAALSIILEEKMELGLAKPPTERIPVASLSESELVNRAILERAERAKAEKMRIAPADKNSVWGDYSVFNPASGRTYRVSLRGWERGQSYCDCPDFRKNTLGTCKHVLRVIFSAKRKAGRPESVKPWKPAQIEVYVDYAAATPTLRMNIPETLPPKAAKPLAPYRGKTIEDVPALVGALRKLADAGIDATVFPDALEYIQRRLFQEHMAALTREIRNNPDKHPLRKTLLKTELLPYQLDGIAFAAGAGRAILADDMGLGKTLQGIGTAELLAREAGIRKVLVICPASLKSQWVEEIARFSDRDSVLVLGSSKERVGIYAGSQFFTICNYEQTLRDLAYIETVPWDLIILDEAQRIKNWETATTRVVKSLKSRFALALTGTPMENRLEELYTVAGFVDEHRLGPAFRFLNTHRETDEKGHVLGYKRIRDLRERLKPILLRRTRDSVMKELPARHTEIIRVEPSEEQAMLHNGNIKIVMQVVQKPFISDMDLLRMRKALQAARMAADSTYLVDKEAPGFSTKLAELESLLGRLLSEDGRKVIIFSEWTTMLDLIERVLKKLLGKSRSYVRLDGSVPQKKRQGLVNQFRKSPDCAVFLTTNAGSTGLNLQAANTVVNVDLPWNPAVLEQRIARAHRMGQKRPVQVYLLVTEDTIEERLLVLLGAKRDLALAALDPDTDVDAVAMRTGMDELKSRLEVLLGRKPDAPRDLSGERGHREEAKARRERIEAAGGNLLTAMCGFLDALLPGSGIAEAARKGVEQAAVTARRERTGAGPRSAFSPFIDEDASGKPRLSLPLPDASVLEKFAAALSGLLAGRKD